MISKDDIRDLLSTAASFDTDALRSFLTSDAQKPLIAVGSGGMSGVAEYVSLLYGTMCGLGKAVTPLEMNSLSDETLSKAKVLLLSKSGKNNDINFAARRCLELAPSDTACMCLNNGDKNKLHLLFTRQNARDRDFLFDADVKDGFVSEGSPIMYLALFAKAFGVLDQVYAGLEATNFSFETQRGDHPDWDALKPVRHLTVLSSGWASPVARLLEGKCVESGWASAQLSDYRNYCHGRFIFTSNHLDDSAVVMLISPREAHLSGQIRSFLPPSTKLFLIRTDLDSPATSLDLLIQTTLLFSILCQNIGVNPDRPSNPGKIDKRAPMNVTFIHQLKEAGPMHTDL